MLCSEIIQVIEAAYPGDAALGFDNVGLLVGRADKETDKVYLAVDATDAVIDHAIASGAGMLVTHHPLIFSSVKRITGDDFVGRRIMELIRNDISCYAMHTNYDVLRMGRLAGQILELENAQVLDVTMEKDGEPEGIGRVGSLKKEMSLEECCVYVKHKLNLGTLKVFGDMERKVSRLAVSPGSGKSAVDPAVAAGADVLVTGDIGHHEGLDAVARGLSVIDAGHYGTEYIFLDDMKQFFGSRLPGIGTVVEPVIHPFQVI